MNNNKNITTFNFIRIILAFSIFLFHLRINFGFTIPKIKSFNVFYGLGNTVMVGFFILSGFVFYYQYHDKSLTNITNLKKFFYKRLISMYPLYWAIFIYILIAKIALYDELSRNLVTIPIEILGLQTLFPEITGNLGNSGTWFISAMLLLYLIFPGLCYLLNHINSKKLSFYIVASYFISVYITIFQTYFNTYVYANPVFRIPEFFIGMLLAALFLEKNKQKNRKKYHEIKIVIAMIVYYVGVNIIYNINFVNRIPFNYSPTYFNILTIPIFSLIIYELAFIENKVILNISNCKVIRYLSNLSYAFYLAQMVTFVEVAKIIRNNNFGLTYQTNNKLFIVTFLFNFLLSIILHELVEKTSKVLLKKRLKI